METTSQIMKSCHEFQRLYERGFRTTTGFFANLQETLFVSQRLCGQKLATKAQRHKGSFSERVIWFLLQQAIFQKATFYVLYRIRWSGRAGGFCCTTTEKIRATNDTNYHEISFVSALIATKGKVSKQRFAFVVQNYRIITDCSMLMHVRARRYQPLSIYLFRNKLFFCKLPFSSSTLSI